MINNSKLVEVLPENLAVRRRAPKNCITAIKRFEGLGQHDIWVQVAQVTPLNKVVVPADVANWF